MGHGYLCAKLGANLQLLLQLAVESRQHSVALLALADRRLDPSLLLGLQPGTHTSTVYTLKHLITSSIP